MGGSFGQAQANDRGIFAALDVTTNKLVWRQSWREICYSGSIVTAGGLLFVGRADGRLTALSSQNGAKLWEFMTDAGVNTTATTFEYKGKQYVVVHAGGGVFANGKRGDGIWMFSLDGKIPSLALGGSRSRGFWARRSGGAGGAARHHPPGECRTWRGYLPRGLRPVSRRGGQRWLGRRPLAAQGAEPRCPAGHRQCRQEQHAGVQVDLFS